MDQFVFHLCGSSGSSPESIMKLFQYGFGVTTISRVELEPADDFTDLGGQVSLAQLGYKKLGGRMSVEEALEQRSPEWPYCVCLYATESDIQYHLNADWKRSGVDQAVGCLRLVRGSHELYGTAWSIDDENGKWKTKEDDGYQAVESACSIEVSGEGEGDRLGMVVRFLMHAHTMQALRTVGPEQSEEIIAII